MEEAPAKTHRRRFKVQIGDILAGLSVAVVVIPQSLAYAELAGMPAYTGLYAAAIPSIAAAFFVSSPYLQTGPVAMTALLTFGSLSSLALPGSSDYVGLAALLALVVGVVRALIGAFKLGSVAYLMSQPVLIGFTPAAAILILSSQLPTAFGTQAPGDEILQRAIWTLTHPAAWELTSLGLSMMTIASILLGRKLHPLFPGVLIAVSLGLGFSLLTHYSGAVVGEIPAGLPHLRVDLPWLAFSSLIAGGSVIALVGFAEAASIARTFAMQDRVPWDANREFIGQGVANLASGLFGGFPVGGSFSRSSINRLAGAKSHWSGAVTGLAVVLFFPFTFMLSALPKAILGAIVIAAVVNLIRPSLLLGLRHYSRPQAFIAWITFALTLALAPRIDIAILLGISLAIAQHLRREQLLVFEHQTDADDTVLHLKPRGVLWFGSTSSFEAEFRRLLTTYPSTQTVYLHLDGIGRIDLSAAIVMKQILQDTRNAGLAIELCDVPPMAERLIQRVWGEEKRPRA